MTKWTWLLIGPIAIFIVLMLVLAGRVTAGRGDVAMGIPTRPPLENAAAELRKRIDRSERDARGGSLAALGELSRLYHANGFSPEAIQCYQALLHADPTNARWPHLLAQLLASYGRLDEALPAEQQAVALAPNHVPARLLLAQIFSKTNRDTDAREAYAVVLSQEKNNIYALQGLALYEIAHNSWIPARDHLLQAIAAQPRFVGALTLLVTVYEHLGDPAAAESTRLKADTAPRFQDFPDEWLDGLMADCYDSYRLSVAAATAGAAGDAATAKRWLERTVELSPAEAWTHRLLGQLLDQLHDYPAANRELRRALELDSREPRNWSQLATLQLHQDDAAGAEKTLLAGLARCPQDGNLHYEYGALLIELGRFDAAVAALREAKRLKPNKSDAYFDLARIYLETGRDKEGVAELHATLTVEPEHPLALLTLARNAVRIGDEAEANVWLARVRRQPRVPAEGVERLLAVYQQRFGHAP